MRRLLTILTFLFMGMASYGQNCLESFVESVRGHFVSADYSFEYKKEKVTVNGEGHIKFLDTAFSLEGNGMRIICDGNIRWTIDDESKECYVEEVNAEGLDYEQNPALLLTAMDRLMLVSSPKPSSFAGCSTTAVKLSASDNSMFSSITAHFLPDGSLLSLVIDASDNARIIITVHNMKKEKPVSPVPTFSFDISSLDDSYVITDFR